MGPAPAMQGSPKIQSAGPAATAGLRPSIPGPCQSSEPAQNRPNGRKLTRANKVSSVQEAESAEKYFRMEVRSVAWKMSFAHENIQRSLNVLWWPQPCKCIICPRTVTTYQKVTRFTHHVRNEKAKLYLSRTHKTPWFWSYACFIVSQCI